MKFRTEYIPPHSSSPALSIDRPVALAGSCFADYVGARMRGALWRAENPLGVLFNPLSIARAISADTDYLTDSVFNHADFFSSFLADSSFSAANPRDVVAKLLDARAQFRQLLGAGRTLIVTFGTTYCYFLADDPSYVVANCHKLPAATFTRRLVGVDEICDCWDTLLGELRDRFPGIHVIFTVSPVRHLRDGIHDNQLSKATLLLAVDRLCRDHDFCSYFPAYEIQLDDLRDYRFYADDLVHPSPQAVEYIWEKFIATYVSAADRKVLAEGEALCRRLNHRPLNPDSRQAEDFRAETARLLQSFQAAHPLALSQK